VYLYRYTSTKCATLDDYSDRENLSGLKISPKSYLLLARENSTLNPNFVMKNVIVGENDCFALVTGTKPIEVEEEQETDDFEFNILDKSKHLKNKTTKAALTNIDKRLIDFVGLADPDKTNYYLGEGPAPYLVDGTAISRCYNGNDTRNNRADFWLENPTPAQMNECTFTKHINNANEGEVLISEVSARNNQGGCLDSNGEDDYIEIYNNTNQKINLAGARLYYVSSTGSVSTYYTFGHQVLEPNSYLVVLSSNAGCFNTTNVSNSLVRSSSFNLSSASASVVLTANNFSFPSPQLQPIPSPGKTLVLDYLGYGNEPKVYRQTPSNEVDNYSMSRCSNNNTSNAIDFAIETNTPGQANSCSGAVQIASLPRGSLLITELLPNPGGSCNANDDFVEIYNTTNQRVQLGGARLFYITSTPSVGTGYTLGYSILEPNSYIVLFNATGGCYSSLTGVNSIYGTGINLSSLGASVALGRNSATIHVSSFPNITEGNNFIIDYVGYYAASKVYKTKAALDGSSCGNNSVRRIQANLDTGNHFNDFICGANNGTPGVSN
ncbi:MAG: lamin tail domain-containing protein, partial [Leptospiraceae bacterium]|nr:lamin tail domain-containing protein [Leptospiraceae bacterium]